MCVGGGGGEGGGVAQGCVSVSLNDIFENLSDPEISAGDIFGPESVSVKIYYG